MGLKEITSNDAVKGLTFLPALEGVNTVIGHLAGYNAKFGAISAYVKEGVDFALNSIPLNSTLVSGVSAIGAGLLSNKVLKDLGLYEEGKTIGSIKNLARYGLNAGAMLATYSAGTVAAPYLIAGAGAYFAGKYGWKYTGKALKGLGGLATRFGKGVANFGIGLGNAAVHTVTDPLRGIYDGVIKNELARPTLQPAYAYAKN